MKKKGEKMVWYRCDSCRTIVSPKDISTGKGCRSCKGIRVRQASLTIREKIYELLRCPSILFKLENWENVEIK